MARWRARPPGGRVDAGLTLIEVMVALFIFALIAMGLLTSVTRSLALSSRNRGRVVAANLAASEMDAVRGMAADNYDGIGTASRTQTVGSITYTATVPGASTLVPVGLAPLDVTLVPDAGHPAASVSGRTIEASAGGGCTETYLSRSPSGPSGLLRFGLPYGTWTLKVQGDTGAGTTVTLAPGAAPTAVTMEVSR